MVRLEFYKSYSWAAEKLGGMCSPEFALFTLMYSFHEADRDCFYSLISLSKMIGCSKSTVQRALKRLKDSGAVTAEQCNFTFSMQYLIDERVVEQWKREWRNNSETWSE